MESRKGEEPPRGAAPSEEKELREWMDTACPHENMPGASRSECWQCLGDRLRATEAAARAEEGRLWKDTIEGKRNMMSDHRVRICGDAINEAERRGAGWEREECAKLAEGYQHARVIKLPEMIRARGDK